MVARRVVRDIRTIDNGQWTVSQTVSYIKRWGHNERGDSGNEWKDHEREIRKSEGDFLQSTKSWPHLCRESSNHLRRSWIRSHKRAALSLGECLQLPTTTTLRSRWLKLARGSGSLPGILRYTSDQKVKIDLSTVSTPVPASTSRHTVSGIDFKFY